LSRFRAEVSLFLVATLWAGTFPVLKVTMAYFPPSYFVSLRFLIAAVIFTIIFRRKVLKPARGEIIAGLVLGALQIIGFTTQSIGLKYTTSSDSALITGVNVLIVPFVQFAITRKRVRIENWIGVIAVTVGLFLLTQPQANGFNIGDLFTMICAFAWAFYIIYLDVFSNKYSNIYVIIAVQFWLVFFLNFLGGLLFENSGSITFSKGSLLALLYTGIFATFIATTLGNKVQKFTTPIRATLILAWETPAAVMLSIISLGESFKAVQLFGAVMMIIGILFSESYDYFFRTKHKAEFEKP